MLSLKKSFLIISGGAVALLGISAINPDRPMGANKIQVGKPLPEQLVREVGYFLTQSIKSIAPHVKNLNNIVSAVYIPEDTYKIAPRVESELNGIVQDLQELSKGLENPSSASAAGGDGGISSGEFDASTFTSLDDIAQDVIEILIALKSSYQDSLDVADHDTQVVSEKGLPQVSKAMQDVLKILINTLQFDITGMIFSDQKLDIESFSKLKFGFDAILTFLKSSSSA